MLKITFALIFSATLFSMSAHAMNQEQQWGNWFGTINAMEFELNADNDVGERMTLTCRDSHLEVSYYITNKDYQDIPSKSLKVAELNINAVHYQPGEAAFMALKSTDGNGQIEITRMNKPISHPFKTLGLQDALKDLNWDDCISH